MTIVECESVEANHLSLAPCGPLEARFETIEAWDRLLAPFLDVVHEQSEIFNSQRWEVDSLERLGFYRDGQLVAAALVMLKPLPFLGSGLAVTKWGPLWRREGYQPDPTILKQALELLIDIYAKQRGFVFSVFPHADPDYAAIEEQIYQQCGFEAGESLTSPNRYFVNCQSSLEEAHASLLQKWRYNLKKARKNDFQIHQFKGDKGYRAFMPLYEAMLRRKDFHDSSAIGTLEKLSNASTDFLQPNYFLVEKDGEAVAGGVIDISGDRAIYLYGATSDQALPLRAGYALHWAVLEHLIEDPVVCWYDLGGADEESPLHQFKRGFVGRSGEIAITPPYYHYADSLKARLICKSLYFIRRHKGALQYNLHGLKHSLMERLSGKGRKA